MLFNSLFNLIFILFSIKNLFNALITSLDLSVIGNTLLPLSTFVFNPYLFSKFIISLFVKLYNALYKNSLFVIILSKKSSIGELLVILHLPLPVMNSFFPNFSFFSNKVTSLSFEPAIPAAIIPAGPPPITAILFKLILP